MRIGVADTTFSRIDMAAIAIETIKEKDKSSEIERYTVPGMKDLPVACKRLIKQYKCEIVIALAWVGKEEIDEQCAHEANNGLINAELMMDTHILKVFFHERETSNEQNQKEITIDRVKKHALNALALIKGKETLTSLAGKGKRQGYTDAGDIHK